MTHSTSNIERESGGSLELAYHDIDITSLDAAGQENYDADAELGISGSGRFGVLATATDPTVSVSWDHVNGHLNVVNVSDATDVASGTAVGRVMLVIVGV